MTTAKPADKLYAYHVRNFRAIDDAVGRTARSLRESVSRDDKAAIATFVRLSAFLLGAWAECRLSKLLYEPGAFTDADRDKITKAKTQLDRWLTVVELAYRKHYKIHTAALTSLTLTHSAYSRYRELTDLLNSDLADVIELRNKLAHGQWVYPLNSEGTNISQQQMDALRNMNALHLSCQQRLTDALCSAIHDLAISKNTFERDFDHHFALIQGARRDIKNRDYQKYANAMQAKWMRGQTKRRNQGLSSPGTP